MVESNLRIIAELKGLLDQIAEDPEMRMLFTESPSDFTRNRKLTFEKVVAFILNMPKRSLSIELYDFFAVLGSADPATKAAFSQQRTKLLPHFFFVWNRFIVNAFYEHYGESVKRWKGFRLLAVDGSTAYLINTKDVVKEFGHQTGNRKDVPMATVVQIHDVLNDIAVWGDLFPIVKSEQAVIAERVHSLYKDSLTIFDRGYPGFGLMFMMINQEVPRHFLMRCKLDFSNAVKDFVEGNEISQTIEMEPSDRARKMLKENGYIITKATTIKVRMVKVILNTGEIEVLLTNLYDENIYPSEEFSQLYFKRWGIEVSYGMQKNQQQMEQFSGHRALCIRQEYYAGLFALNLQAIVEKQCKPFLNEINTTRKHSYKINKNISRSFIKGNVVKLLLQEKPEIVLLLMQKIFERHIEPIRPNRQSPRTNKTTRMHGKYQTVTNYRRAL